MAMTQGHDHDHGPARVLARAAPQSLLSAAMPGTDRHAPAHAAAGTRDIRLDFFRGIAMFIILIAHIPGNRWTLWIPARFGFSDATEIFVFCSGMASAIAFGGTFQRMGWAIGTARVAYRIWQVYWAHIGMFLVIAALVALVDRSGAFAHSYTGGLNLTPFFRDTGQNLIGLLTLTYVPNYFDVLPMYLGILAMLPVLVLLAGASRLLAGAAVLAVWLGANLGLLAFPAEPWSERKWFFNPFGWQLLFFTGFALMRGWLPAPPLRRWLIWLALALVLLSVPLAWFRILDAVPQLKLLRDSMAPLVGKTNFGALRYLHFLALAYLAWALAGEGGKWLVATRGGFAATVWNGISKVVLKVGQQALAVFVFSMVLARVLGFVLDRTGSSALTMAAVNLTGFALIAALAYGAGWFKGQPWRQRKTAA